MTSNFWRCLPIPFDLDLYLYIIYTHRWGIWCRWFYYLVVFIFILPRFVSFVNVLLILLKRVSSVIAAVRALSYSTKQLNSFPSFAIWIYYTQNKSNYFISCGPFLIVYSTNNKYSQSYRCDTLLFIHTKSIVRKHFSIFMRCLMQNHCNISIEMIFCKAKTNG